MKKISNNKLQFLTLFFFTGVFISCNDDIENLGKKDKPELTASGSTSISVAEGENAVLTFKLDKAINEPIQYRLVLLENESTASDQLDYIIPGCRSNDPDCVAIEENGGPVGYIFEIPAYTTEYSVNIATIFDDLNEGTENLKLQVISNRTLLGTVDNLFFDISITNSVSNDLNIRFDWSGSFSSEGEEVDNCDLDLDLELYDELGDLIDFSYSNCPESLILNTADLADGTYNLYASLWTTSGYIENINIPANIQFIKPGSLFNESYDLSSSFPMQDGGLDDGNSNAAVEFTIVKSGSVYTITNDMGETVFEGRMATPKIRSSRKK